MIINEDAFHAVFGAAPQRTAPTHCPTHQWIEVHRSENEYEPDLINIQKVCNVCGEMMFATRRKPYEVKIR